MNKTEWNDKKRQAYDNIWLNLIHFYATIHLSYISGLWLHNIFLCCDNFTPEIVTMPSYSDKLLAEVFWTDLLDQAHQRYIPNTPKMICQCYIPNYVKDYYHIIWSVSCFWSIIEIFGTFSQSRPLLTTIKLVMINFRLHFNYIQMNTVGTIN